MQRMSPETVPLLTDEQIATHEAGHALVAHLMGDTIETAFMYQGEQRASIKPASWPPSRATILAGMAAEVLLGFTVYPQRAAKDSTIAAALPHDPGNPSPRGMLMTHKEAFDALRLWFTEARVARQTIPGSDIHSFLDARHCLFGSSKTRAT